MAIDASEPPFSKRSTNDPILKPALNPRHANTTIPNYGTMPSSTPHPPLPHANTTTTVPTITSASATISNPPRPSLPRAATSTTAIIPSTKQQTSRPSLFRRVSSYIETAATSTQPNRPAQPSHWTDHAHQKPLLQLWDSSHENAAAAAAAGVASQPTKPLLARSVTTQLAVVEKAFLAQFPELKEGEVPLSRAWVEYVLGVLLRHPFCAEGRVGRWEVLAGAAKVGGMGAWGPW